MKLFAAVVLVMLLLCGPASVPAATVAPRFLEGSTHGFLMLRGPAGETVAQGEFQARSNRVRVHSHLTWRFKDGSRQEEVTEYTERPVLKLLRFKQTQRGPTFPTEVEVAFARSTSRYTIARWEKGKDAERAEGTFELPDDVYNGMTFTVMKNLPRGATGTGQMLVFTPKPRLVKMTFRPDGQDPVVIGESRRVATRYLVDLELGGIAGIFAPIVGKEPPDLKFWILHAEVPAFVRFQGPFFLNGPVWTVELASPRWPR